MRVISGKARSLKLKTIDGDATRPTTDRIKETLFNMIQYDIYDSVFLDLFSGSGAIGIEALSRGAEKCYFVENNRKAVQCIQDNLNSTKLIENAVVLSTDALSSIDILENKKEVFSFIFMDPPYNQLLEKTVLLRLASSSILDDDTVIIVEASLDADFDYVSDYGMHITKEKKYKTNKHIFIQKD